MNHGHVLHIHAVCPSSRRTVSRTVSSSDLGLFFRAEKFVVLMHECTCMIMHSCVFTWRLLASRGVCFLCVEEFMCCCFRVETGLLACRGMFAFVLHEVTAVLASVLVLVFDVGGLARALVCVAPLAPSTTHSPALFRAAWGIDGLAHAHAHALVCVAPFAPATTLLSCPFFCLFLVCRAAWEEACGLPNISVPNSFRSAQEYARVSEDTAQAQAQAPSVRWFVCLFVWGVVCFCVCCVCCLPPES